MPGVGAADFIKANVFKPVVGHEEDSTAPEGKTMGHAGAIVSGSSGTAPAEELEAASEGGKTPSETAALARDGSGGRAAARRSSTVERRGWFGLLLLPGVADGREAGCGEVMNDLHAVRGRCRAGGGAHIHHSYYRAMSPCLSGPFQLAQAAA